MAKASLSLFEAYGIELEYMLVDVESLDVRPIADQVLASLMGEIASDAPIGPITWSNELALHMLELKTTLPARQLQALPDIFKTAIANLQSTLSQLDAILLPTAVHPWMSPATETQLWPHEFSDVYQTYDRIFDCRTHGWSNVQSVHLNLPFQGDAEFERLHAAVRIVLPLLPAIAASSPIMDGKYSGMLDTRMRLYEGHCHALPFLTGQTIPEPVFNQKEYRKTILDPIGELIQPHDPDGHMQADFSNARGAIARFDRGSVEVRVMDVQEYPLADVAICAAAAAVIEALCNQQWSTLDQQKAMSTRGLRDILQATSTSAGDAVIEDREFLVHFGLTKSKATAAEVWALVLESLRPHNSVLDELFAPLQTILDKGSLANRITNALGSDFSRHRLQEVYRALSECLTQWKSFQA